MKIKRPPVLSDEETRRWMEEKTHWGRNTIANATPEDTREIQRDADSAYYEPKIEVREAELAGKDAAIRDLRLQLEQARAEVADKIFEEIEPRIKEALQAPTHEANDYNCEDWPPGEGCSGCKGDKLRKETSQWLVALKDKKW